MKNPSRFLRIALLSWGLATVTLGCSGMSGRPGDPAGVLGQPGGAVPNTGVHIEELLAEVYRLRTASHESLDAAATVGTAERELADARQALATGEGQLREGEAAYAAREYQRGWEKLWAAREALRRSEERAVQAGLGQVERALAAEYAPSALMRNREKSPVMTVVRVRESTLNLHDGAGESFQVVGKAHMGDVLEVLGDAGEWYHVTTRAGLRGWVSKALVTRVPELGLGTR